MKIFLLILLIFNFTAFGKVNSSVSRLEVSKEIIGDWTQNIIYTTNNFKITGLGNTKLSYKIENFGNIHFLKEDGNVEDSIKINWIELDSLDSYIDKDNETITLNRGNCNLKVQVSVTVKGNSRLGGKYRSRPISLIIYGEKNNKDEEVKIDIYLELNVIKRLKVSTTTMDLGVGVQGQKMSSNQGTHGYLKVEGEPNKGINISYPSEVEIFNKKGNDSLKVEITSPELEKNGENYIMKLSPRGEDRVRFIGEIKDTKNAQAGEYNGELKIKVRYD